MTDGQIPGHEERAERLFMLAEVEAGLGNDSAALKEAKRALDVALKAGDAPLAIQSLARQAQMLIGTEKYVRARNTARRALALSREVKDKSGIALSYYILGQVEFHSGHLDAAFKFYRESLRRTRASGIKEGQASVLHQLGVISFLRRDFDTAERYLKRALPMFSELGQTEPEARSRYHLGMVRRGRGELARAEEDFDLALDLARRTQSTTVVSQCLNAKGDVCFAQGQRADARLALDECLKLRRDTNDRHGLANTLQVSAQVHVADGRLDEAKQQLEESITICREARLDGILADALSGMAMVCQLKGEPALAATIAQESIATAEATGDPTRTVSARLMAARLAEADGRREDVVRHLVAAAGLSQLIAPNLGVHVITKLLHAESELPKADVARLYQAYEAARLQAKRRPGFDK